MRVAFDSRSVSDPRGVGRYASCMLEAPSETAGPHSQIMETHRPRRADVFHSPWIDGALLRSPCPMVVTLHDLVQLKRRSEYLRTGMRFRLRYLAVQRAMRVIVPTEAVAADAVEHLAELPVDAPAQASLPLRTVLTLEAGLTSATILVDRVLGPLQRLQAARGLRRLRRRVGAKARRLALLRPRSEA